MAIDSPKGPECPRVAYEPRDGDRVMWRHLHFGTVRVDAHGESFISLDPSGTVYPSWRRHVQPDDGIGFPNWHDDSASEVERLTAEVERLREQVETQHHINQGWARYGARTNKQKRAWRAEVSRLREQLAAQPKVPADAEDQLRIAIADPGSRLPRIHYTPERASEPVSRWSTRAVLDLLKSWGVSSSEVEAPQPQQHVVTVQPHGQDWWAAKCPECDLTQYSPSKQRAEDWKDQHEADTLRPQAFADYDLTDVKPGNGFFVEKDPSSPPSGGDSDTTPRVWPAGSPEPDRDANEVADNENVFVRNRGSAGGWMWKLDGIIRAGLRFEWEFINERELTEVLPSPSSLPQEGGTDD